MPKRITIPKFAKDSAKEGLKESKINKAGLDIFQAKMLGIQSGRERAKQIIRNKYLYEDDLKSIARFYMRFKNCKSPRCETAIKLWGGRRFGNFLSKIMFKK